jgi:choline-sulfatase
VRSYYSSVEYLDNNVGRVLRALDELGLADSTLVVYTSDHGYLLDHHRRFEKHMMWEEAERVPLIVRDPRRKAGVSQALVELVDLVPTILDALGVPQIEGTHGRSLEALLAGRAGPHRDQVFAEYMHDNKAMLRTEKWKYVFATGEKDLELGYQTGKGPAGLHERLYDLAADPREFRNVAADPANREILADLRARTLRVFEETDPRASRLPAGLSEFERLSRFVQPVERDPSVPGG